MKIGYFILLFFISVHSFGQKSNPFLSLNFDKVVMYDFDGGKGIWSDEYS